ncbi:MAG: outer membrane protein assembly factor BamC [Pseudomonas sp.]|uniref:outer membrane protein assembly factor BamC n=1 Tax=Pseudomonas sp. TaxID=306 RepID=UPI003BB50219
MKRLAGLSVLALMISSTSGCGWLWGEDGYFRDRGNDYLDARETAPMQLPAGVKAKRLDPLLPIPGNVAGVRIAEGDAEFEVPRPPVLKDITVASDFSLQKSGDSRWIVAQRPPAEVWPVARQFFEDNGFKVVDEHPQAGEFSTAWQPIEQISSTLARRLSSRVAFSEAGGETRVRVRVEPGVQRNTSEVFVVSVERAAGSTADLPWPSSAGNPGLEAALLDEMLANLSRSAEQGGSVSLLAGQSFDTPSRISMIADGNGNPILSLGADLDRSWSSVGRSLDLAQIHIDDLNRSLGVYYINLDPNAAADEKPGFFSWLPFVDGAVDPAEIEESAERYQVRLTKVGDSVQVSVEKDANTVAPADVARSILSRIQENLG